MVVVLLDNYNGHGASTFGYRIMEAFECEEVVLLFDWNRCLVFNLELLTLDFQEFFVVAHLVCFSGRESFMERLWF